MYTSVDPAISILVLDEAELRNAELSGAVTAPSNSFFETGPPDHMHRTTGPTDHGTTGPPDHRTTEPLDQRTTGPRDHETTGPPDH